MKGLKKVLLLLLTLSLVTGSLYSTGWAEDKEEWAINDPVGQGWNAVDLLVARPIGVIAGICLGLPFLSSRCLSPFLPEGCLMQQICLLLNPFNSPLLGNSRMRVFNAR